MSEYEEVPPEEPEEPEEGPTEEEIAYREEMARQAAAAKKEKEEYEEYQRARKEAEEKEATEEQPPKEKPAEMSAVARVFGPEFEKQWREQTTKKDLPLPEDTIKECIQYAKSNMDPSVGKATYKNHDIVLVTTPQTEKGIKRRILEATGALSIPFLYPPSPNGWIGTIFQDPSRCDDIEVNTAYFIIGKYSEQEYQGEKLPKMKNCKAIIKVE